MRHIETVILTGKYLRETEKACQFLIETINGVETDDTVEVNQWFPYSQVVSITHGKLDEADTLVVSKWIMQQKELL